MRRRHRERRAYHHGNLAESLLNAVDELATQFGLEAVTLRGCAKLVGVSPSSAFRHYADKRALLTAFATRALHQLADENVGCEAPGASRGTGAFRAVGLAYIEFALDKPAFFRAMWREEAIYAADEAYVAAANELSAHLRGGFADTIEDNDPPGSVRVSCWPGPPCTALPDCSWTVRWRGAGRNRKSWTRPRR